MTKIKVKCILNAFKDLLYLYIYFFFILYKFIIMSTENQNSENKKQKQLPQNFLQKIKHVVTQSKTGKFNWLGDNSFTIVPS